jgi:hypothetical protein
MCKYTQFFDNGAKICQKNIKKLCFSEFNKLYVAFLHGFP